YGLLAAERAGLPPDPDLDGAENFGDWRNSDLARRDLFEAGLLRRAYAQDELASTDDAGLVERLGETVVAVEGDPRNIKITRGHDLPVVRALGGFRPPAERASHKKF
ncbi:MAG: 2-C-methyl-D-erythritol 4-phosphate cytidylyltransferase, partial [Planctomycetota bacterium]